MKIGEIARLAGLTAYTIRYYERIGLLPHAGRDASSQRVYDASILDWIEFIGRLKMTGMPIRDMLRYAQLREEGVATEAERRELLKTHRDAVQAHVRELQACLRVLDTKIAGYADAPTGKHHDDQHDTQADPSRKPIRARPARPL